MPIIQRHTIAKSGQGRIQERNTGKVTSRQNSSVSYTEKENLILSFNGTKVRGAYRDGLGFACDKDNISILSVTLTDDMTKYQGAGLIDTYYSGDFLLDVGNLESQWPSVRFWSDNDYALLGTMGFSRANPTKPLANAAEFLAELRDLPKLPVLESIKKRAFNFREMARNSGSEYLNLEFGWRPFVNDVVDMTASTLKSKKHIAQFIKDSGKTVRHRRKLEVKNPSSSVHNSGTSYGWPSNIGLQVEQGTYISHDTITSESWFVGAFTYYVQPAGANWYSPDSIKRGEQIMNHLYGTRITPSLLWKLAPWSWMNSYFGNVGQVIDNLTAFDGDNLCMRYGYVMTKSVATRTYTLSGVKGKNGKPIPPVSTVLTRKSMRRRKVSPYGIASSSSLSAKQLAILGALSISRT